MTPGQGVADLLGGRLTDEIFAALPAQTVVVTGTNAAGIVLPRLAAQLAAAAPAVAAANPSGTGLPSQSCQR